jgi:cyclopropane fatty-acyl-phospholipid synthase-like methyltransferase
MNFFTFAYLFAPPWDIGRPQKEIVRLEEEDWISGSVLDTGCGTGENALYLASRGHEVWGVDMASNAVRKARKKALERGIAARFLRADALELERLGREFDTVVDCGLFHTFSDEKRVHYAASLAAVVRRGGKVVLMCFSEQETVGFGPRRVSQAEIRSTFDKGWAVLSITPANFEGKLPGGGARAWVSLISRE